jgi:hypothetical protein
MDMKIMTTELMSTDKKRMCQPPVKETATVAGRLHEKQMALHLHLDISRLRSQVMW